MHYTQFSWIFESAMARGTAATSRRDDQEPPAQAESKASKRRCVQSACVPCRKRKSKCDGGTPVCATCTAVYKTDCHYDAESESRRSKTVSASTTNAGNKREAPTIAALNGDASSSSAFFLIKSLRTLPEDEAFDLIAQIRKDPKLDVAAFAETWRKNMSLPPSTPVDVNSLETDLSLLLAKPSVSQSGQSRHFGHTAGLGLVPEDENFGTGQSKANFVHTDRKGTTWTNVTSDLAFVENLLALYFSWNHPFYVVLSRECFYKDFSAGRDKYCSPLLVNAICAYACHLTDDPAGRTDPSNFRTAGDHFFEEARNLLFEDETPSLTTVQALCVMSMREPSTGRDTSGYSYISRCMRMCIELGLHLSNSTSSVLCLTPSEIEVRKVTFWGCFTVDSVWSICTGRIAGLPRAAITLDKPTLEELSNPLDTPSGPSRTQPVLTTRMFLHELTTLSELVNDNNYMFFAPKERLTSTRLMDCYDKYQKWYERLPLALQIKDKEQPEPHTLVLHMLYHTIIVHLFRPMVKVELMNSTVHPRDICIDAANKVSELVRTYRMLYDLRVAHLVIPHILLTVSIVHLLYSRDNPISYQNLVEGLQALEDLHECHYFGARSFRILHTLSETWNLPWPKEMLNSKLLQGNMPSGSQATASGLTDPLLVEPNTFSATRSHTGINTTFSLSSIGHAGRRESLSMFNPQVNSQLVTNSTITRPGSVPNQYQQSHAISHSSNNAYNALPYQFSQNMSSVGSNVARTATSGSSDPSEAIFWNPIPGVPGPILPRNTYQQISPMGLDSVLQQQEIGDRLGRDGFKMSEDWQSSQVHSFTSGSGSYSQQNHQPQTPGYIHRGSQSYQQQGDRMQFRGQTHNPQQSGQEDFSTTWYGSQMG